MSASPPSPPQRNLREAGRKAKDQKGIIDQAAAQIILQGWLDAQV